MKEILRQILIKILYKESELILKKHKPKVIAVTGTVGKTSTKDAIYTALREFEYVRKSPKSFNSEIGIPLTILDVQNPGNDILGWVKVLLEGVLIAFFPSLYPKWLVLEVGTDKPGDIEEITKWLKPDVVVVTKLAPVPVHVEAFSSPEMLFEEKGKLVQALKNGGTLILNADDERVMAFKELTNEKVMTFGKNSKADVWAEDYKLSYNDEKVPQGVSFNVYSGDSTEPVEVGLSGTLGEHNYYHVLAALTVVRLIGEDIHVGAESFKYENPAPGRTRIIEGIKESIIIDDTYNSSPIAVEESLKTLKSTKSKVRGGRRVAILGDMLELGKFTVDEHKKVGEIASDVATILATVGVRSRYTAEVALELGMKETNVFQFDDSTQAGEFMKNEIRKGDIILVKGSQGMRMERLVEQLMLHPEDKQKLLVRQDKEWRSRV